ncbi:hypothetical protein S245_052303 [Arachis hypogaea]
MAPRAPIMAPQAPIVALPTPEKKRRTKCLNFLAPSNKGASTIWEAPVVAPKAPLQPSPRHQHCGHQECCSRCPNWHPKRPSPTTSKAPIWCLNSGALGAQIGAPNALHTLPPGHQFGASIVAP